MIKVWRYWVIRPNAPLLVAPVALVSVLVLQLSWKRGPLSLVEVAGQNFVLFMLFLVPLLWLCRRSSKAALVGNSYSAFFAEVFRAQVLGMAAATLIVVFLPNLSPRTNVALVAICLSGIVLISLRPLLKWLLRRKKFVEGLLVLGSGEMATKFSHALVDTTSSGQADGSVGGTGPVHSAVRPLLSSLAVEASSPGVAVTFDQLREITLRDGISRIVVAEPNVHNSKALAVAILDCKLQGLEVEQAVESYERFNSKVWLEGIRPDWLVYSYGFKPPRYYLQLKRVLDVVAGILLLILAAPVMILIAIAIRIDSEGDVLFRQERVGWHNKPFVLFKFRTMRMDAEQASGPVWAGVDDPRITRLGKWLRKFRLDEIPQLMNVVRGEMSLVGPRPEREHFVRLLNESVPYYSLRHCVKPGVTGWAQVLYPYGASVEDAYEKLQYDLYYAKHMSLSFDMRIMLSTARVVLFGRGR